MSLSLLGKTPATMQLLNPKGGPFCGQDINAIGPLLRILLAFWVLYIKGDLGTIFIKLQALLLITVLDYAEVLILVIVS